MDQSSETLSMAEPKRFSHFFCIHLPHRTRRPPSLPKRRKSAQLDPPLPPKPRKRALSIPRTYDAPCPYTIDQVSILFRLPLEIRRQIWAEVLGGYVIHFIMPMRVLSHFVCPSPESVVCACRINDFKTYAKMPERMLGVLVTCRQIYSEAIEYLYSANTFSILYSNHLIHLSALLLPARLNAIRTLRIRWSIRGLPFYVRPGWGEHLTFREDTEYWQQSWRALANMSGLRYLHIHLIDTVWQAQWLKLESTLLAPVKDVKAPRVFEVILPYEESNVGLDVGDSACVFRNPAGDGEKEEEEC